MTFSDLATFVGKSAPLLANALLGPAAGSAVGMITSIFGGNSENADDVFKKMVRDPEVQMKLMQLEADQKIKLQELEIQRLKIDSSERLAQVEVNKIDSSSQDKYQARWRATIAYICGAGLAWAYFLQPILAFIVITLGFPRTYPNVPTADIMSLLLSLLGFSYIHSREKIYETKK